MSEQGLPQRFRHRAVLIFLLGGASGAAVNLLIGVSLWLGLGWNPYLSFFLGTLANELFHHFCYYVVYANQEIRMRTSLPLHMALYLCVAAIGVGILWLFLHTGLGFVLAAILSILVLSMLNAVLNRVSTFSSAELAAVEYREMNESYYDDHTDPTKVNRIRAWFHRSRFERLTRFVQDYYHEGMLIADVGCGNCWWNVNGLPVTGVDINQKMLKWAVEHGRLREFRFSDSLAHTGLPSSAFDIVVMSETLEHLLELDKVLAEVKRVLKGDGKFLITVPYDFFLGPFFVLFNINCVYQGYVKGSRYHQFRCGHINHFTKSRLRNLLTANGFELQSVRVVNGLLLYAVATRRHARGEVAIVHQ